MKQTDINAQKLKAFTGRKYENGELDNNGLVQQIEQCGGYLNLMLNLLLIMSKINFKINNKPRTVVDKYERLKKINPLIKDFKLKFNLDIEF